MKALLGYGLGALLTALLATVCTNMHSPSVETDLMASTQGALEKASIPGVMVDAKGLQVILKGEVPDEATKAKAGLAAMNVWGVADVVNNLTIKPGAVLMTKQERAAAVDCQAEFKQLLTTPIRFATASSVVAAVSHPLLDQLVAAAEKCPAAQIEIGGHTDPRGGHDMNVKLSQARADSVRAYLVQKGVAATRLSAMGYGPDKPIANNATAAGMEQNRRTEFVVKGL